MARDGQRSRLARADLCCEAAKIADFGQRMFDFAPERHSLRRWPHAIAGTNEKSKADVGLEARDLCTHRRLGKAQGCGGLRNRTAVQHRPEGLKESRVNLHRFW